VHHDLAEVLPGTFFQSGSRCSRPRAPGRRTACASGSGRHSLVDHLPVTFTPKPLRHCTNGGGELDRSTVPRDGVCITIRPMFSRGLPPGQVRAAAAPALHEQRRRAGREHRAEKRVCIMIWPTFSREPPPGHGRTEAAPALPEQRRRPVRSTVPRDGACLMSWPTSARGPPPGHARAEAAPALPEQRRRAGQEHRAEGQRVPHVLADVLSWTSSRSCSHRSRPCTA
jgi:hypothetical protein